MVSKYSLDTYGIDPPIFNGDQMPLHRNEYTSQKTLSLKSEMVFVKESYMLSTEKVTCFTQLRSDPKGYFANTICTFRRCELSMGTKRIVSHQTNIRDTKETS